MYWYAYKQCHSCCTCMLLCKAAFPSCTYNCPFDILLCSRSWWAVCRSLALMSVMPEQAQSCNCWLSIPWFPVGAARMLYISLIPNGCLIMWTHDVKGKGIMSWWQDLQLWLSLSKKDWPGIIHRGSSVYFVHLQMKDSASHMHILLSQVSLGGGDAPLRYSSRISWCGQPGMMWYRKQLLTEIMARHSETCCQMEVELQWCGPRYTLCSLMCQISSKLWSMTFWWSMQEEEPLCLCRVQQ